MACHTSRTCASGLHSVKGSACATPVRGTSGRYCSHRSRCFFCSHPRAQRPPARSDHASPASAVHDTNTLCGCRGVTAPSTRAMLVLFSLAGQQKALAVQHCSSTDNRRRWPFNIAMSSCSTKKKTHATSIHKRCSASKQSKAGLRGWNHVARCGAHLEQVASLCTRHSHARHCRHYRHCLRSRRCCMLAIIVSLQRRVVVTTTGIRMRVFAG